MKKILCLCLSIIFLTLAVVPSVFAEEQTSVPYTESVARGALDYTCSYDVEKKQVIIDGTVSHDFLRKHNDYKIKVYSIAPGQTYESVVEDPESVSLGSSDMTVKFTFSVPVKGILERYCMYAVVMTSPDGKNHYTREPMMPSISSSFSYDASERTYFKGIEESISENINSSDAGTVIIEVDLSKTLGNAADSIPYPMSNAYTNIKKSYIEGIDKQVLAASLQGSRVYIRLVLHSNDPLLSYVCEENTSRYTLPKLNSEYALEYIFTVSKFFAERYNGENYGKISGMILGKSIDDTTINAIGEMDVLSYAESYTLGLVVVGNAVRAVRADFDIVIPLSDINDYRGNGAIDSIIRPSVLLEQIISRLDKNVSGTYDCSVMLESTYTPLKVAENGSLERNEDAERIYADTLSGFTAYLSVLKNMYKSVPSNIIFKWTPKEELKGNLLCASYVYNYLRLIDNSAVSSFVLDAESDTYGELATCVKYIDTKSFDKLLDIANFYGYTSWSELMGTEAQPHITHTLIETELSQSRPHGIVGEFMYTDFTSSSVYSIMRAGQNATYLRPDYNSDGERVLRVESNKLAVADTVSTVGIFEYAESYEYTEYLSLTVGVADKTASSDALYRVSLTVGSGSDRLVAEGVVRNDETRTLYFEVSEFAQSHRAQYINISVTPLTEQSNACVVQLSSITGYSREYDTETLATLVEERRAEYLQAEEDESDGFDLKLVLTLIGVAFAMIMTGVGLFILFGRDEHREKNKE